jgi:chromosome segregation ATPase
MKAYTFQEFLDSLKILSENNPSNKDIYVDSGDMNNINNQLRIKLEEALDKNEALIQENEQLKNDLLNEQREKSELKFELESIQKKYQNEFKLSELTGIEKDKKLYELTNAINQYENITKELTEKLKHYEDVFQNMSKTESKSNNENPIYDETVQKLLVEVDKRDEIIEKLKNEIVSREQVFKDISKMKNEIDSYTGKISLLYNEIKARDKIIEELKSNNPNLNQLNDLENNESNFYKSKYEEEKMKNDKLRNSISDVTVMIKQLNDSKDQMKNAYENTIKELMNTINKNKLESGNDNEINDELLKQNVELKKMNEFLISKLESLPDLEKKFQELFEMINILKKENETLKQKLNSKNL